MKRSSGVLLPMSALPSEYGIGTMGKCAYDFIDFLKAAGQSWWQLLPLGHTGPAGTPYTSPSAFGGNPNYIDFDMLVADGLLTLGDIPPCAVAADNVDYRSVEALRDEVLRKAFENGRVNLAHQLEAFCRNTPWLENYALYMALKRRFGGAAWYDWPRDIKSRTAAAIELWREKLSDDVAFYEFCQYLFFHQWNALREYAHKNGVSFIGDVPIYVAADSADVWSEPEFFLLRDDGRPAMSAGVPPDYFSKEGQLWGNPLYDWEKMRADGWGWWIRRMDGAVKLFDAVRIDHFRALASYWAVPAGEKTAINGKWMSGPGMGLVGVLKDWFSGTQFIAEDLGVLTPDVVQLLNTSGLPGMKVLEFAFTPGDDSAYLPHNFDKNCVCYAGTHDNDTIMGWLQACTPEEREFARKYLAINREEGWCFGLIRGGMSSTADLFIAQMQDLLEKPGDCRTNTPGTVNGNWQWRLKPGECTKELAEKLHGYTKLYGRI